MNDLICNICYLNCDASYIYDQKLFTCPKKHYRFCMENDLKIFEEIKIDNNIYVFYHYNQDTTTIFIYDKENLLNLRKSFVLNKKIEPDFPNLTNLKSKINMCIVLS